MMIYRGEATDRSEMYSAADAGTLKSRDRKFGLGLGPDLESLVSESVSGSRPNVSARSRSQNFGPDFDEEAKISDSAGLYDKDLVSDLVSRVWSGSRSRSQPWELIRATLR